VVIELIDERDEAACLIFVVAIKLRHVAEEHRLIGARDLDVVILTSGTSTECGKIEPDGRARLMHNRDGPALDLHAVAVRLTVREPPKECRKAFCGRGRTAWKIDARGGEIAQSIVGAGVDLEQIVTHELVDEGVKSFGASYDSLIKTIEEKSSELVHAG